jgi:hypothetical protein
MALGYCGFPPKLLAHCGYFDFFYRSAQSSPPACDYLVD